MPSLDQRTKYKVYTLRSRKQGHISVVFSHQDSHFIAISLIVDQEEDATPAKAYPSAQILDPDEHVAKLKFCDELEINANQILKFATQTMEQFGDYNLLTNNCQNYADKFLKNLGVKNRLCTDLTQASIVAGTTGILAFLIGAVATIFGGRRR